MTIRRIIGILILSLLVTSSQSSASGLNFKRTTPLNNKGDVYVRTATSDASLAIGTNGQVLSADSSTLTGLKWVTLPSGSGTVTNSGTLTSNAVIIGQGTTVVSAITADTASSGHFLASTATSPAFRQIVSSDMSGVFQPSSGGTGFSSFTKGNILSSSGTTDLAKLAVGTNGTHLSADSGAALGISWQKTNLADSGAITGTVGVANGGTGVTSGTLGGVVFFNTTSAITSGTLVSIDSLGSKMSIGPNTSSLVSLDVTGNFRTTPIALTDGATIATDVSRGNIFTVTLGGNRTLGTPTNPTNGQKVIWIISQDATGTRTLAYSPAFRFGTTVASPTLTTTAGAQDYFAAIYNVRGVAARYLSWDCVSFSAGYPS